MLNNKKRFQTQLGQRKLYVKPKIVHELNLETRAGSALSNGDDELLLPSLGLGR